MGLNVGTEGELVRNEVEGRPLILESSIIHAEDGVISF